MNRVIAGVLLGLLIAGGGAALYGLRPTDGCLGACGEGTRCVGRRCVPATAPAVAPAPAADKPRRHRRAASSSASSAASAEVVLRPGDDKMVTQGDALGRPEHVDFTAGGSDGRVLEQDELDRVLHAADPAITRCITTAVGDAPLETGRIEIGLRVERSGTISRVRVEAPALLQRNNLTPCLRKAVAPLRFPASGGATVASWTFALQ